MYLVTHFTGILIYAFPSKNENAFKKYTYSYVYPYFHQNWQMFVPPPNQNFRLFVKDDQHDWKDVFSEVVQLHQSNRLGGHENTFLSMSGALRYYSSSAAKTSFLKTDDGTNTNLRVLDQVLVGYCMSKHKERPKNMEIIIMITDTYDNKSYAHYYKN